MMIVELEKSQHTVRSKKRYELLRWIKLYILAIQANWAVDVDFHFASSVEDALHSMERTPVDLPEWNSSSICTTRRWMSRQFYIKLACTPQTTCYVVSFRLEKTIPDWWRTVRSGFHVILRTHNYASDMRMKSSPVVSHTQKLQIHELCGNLAPGGAESEKKNEREYTFSRDHMY